jgi:hypothetical protein
MDIPFKKGERLQEMPGDCSWVLGDPTCFWSFSGHSMLLWGTRKIPGTLCYLKILHAGYRQADSLRSVRLTAGCHGGAYLGKLVSGTGDSSLRGRIDRRIKPQTAPQLTTVRSIHECMRACTLTMCRVSVPLVIAIDCSAHSNLLLTMASRSKNIVLRCVVFRIVCITSQGTPARKFKNLGEI